MLVEIKHFRWGADMIMKRETMDEAGRIRIPGCLLKMLGWENAENFTATTSHDSLELRLSVTNPFGARVKLDDLGRVSLDKELRENIGWLNVDSRDIVAVRPCVKEGQLIFKLHEKFKHECAFCGKADVEMIINDVVVCGTCAGVLAKVQVRDTVFA